MVELISLGPLWAQKPPIAATLGLPWLARALECARPMESGRGESHSANVRNECFE